MTATLEPTANDIATLPDAARKYAITIPIKSRYDNWIGGQFRAPVKGRYFSNPTPITGQHLCDVARSTAEDVELALDAAHAAAPAWGKTSAAARTHHPQQDRRPARAESRRDRRDRDASTTASRFARRMAADLPLADRSLPLLRGRVCARRKVPPASWTTTPSRTTTTSRSASSRRSFRGISRCSWRCGSSRRRSPPETQSCSSRPSRRRCRSWRSWS